jgi:NAD(P)H-dependent FMN reductase
VIRTGESRRNTSRTIPFAELPLYGYDYDSAYPPPGKALKDAIAPSDAILFITPEYNRSIPGALKNAIDWRAGPTDRTRLRASRRR